MMRLFLTLFFLLAETLAFAQGFPSKPLRIVVPYPAGGTTDMLARTLAQRLSEGLKQPVMVENRPGAGGNIGMDMVAKAPADGYVLGISATNSFAINPHLTAHLPYDPIKDLTQISMLGFVPNIIVVHPDVAARSIAELVALAKKKPLAFASPGPGTTLHLAGEMFNAAAGITMMHVPYKGDMQALQDVIGGQVPVMMSNLAVVLPFVRSGKLRALAVTTARRAAQLPKVPTMIEAGFKDFDISVWFTLFTASGTHGATLERLNYEIARALQAPDVVLALRTSNIEPVSTSLEETRAYTLAEYERWGRIVKKTGVTWD